MCLLRLHETVYIEIVKFVSWEMSRIDCKDWQFSRFHVCRFCKKKKKRKWFFDFLVTLFFLLAFHLFIVGKQIEFYESISQQLT